MATSATLVRVLKAMDKGVLNLLLERYGGAGLIANNSYLYALSEWYSNQIETNPPFYEAHNVITAASQPNNIVKYTCECGEVFSFSQDRVAGFGEDEFIVFHQLDFAWQRMAPKDRPQWWKFQ